MSLEASVLELVRSAVTVKSAVLEDKRLVSGIAMLAETTKATLQGGGKVFFAGNGGSFADSMHLAAEFIARFDRDRGPLAAIALGTNNSALSAIGNDYSFADIFARELESLGRQGDLFIGISTSGNSENIVRAVTVAKDNQLEVCCLTGQDGGRLKGLADCLCVPSTVTARIQETHILIGHIVCELVDELFAE